MAAVPVDKPKPNGVSPASVEPPAASPHSLQAWSQFLQPFSVAVAVVAVVVALIYSREQTIHQQYAIEREQLHRQRDIDSHQRSWKCQDELQAVKETKQAVADFFKERLNRALMCYRQMARQVNKDKNSGVLKKILESLTTVPGEKGENAPLLDGSADPYDYVECYREMNAIANGLRLHGGEVKYQELGGFRQDSLNRKDRPIMSPKDDEEDELVTEMPDPEVVEEGTGDADTPKESEQAQAATAPDGSA